MAIEQTVTMRCDAGDGCLHGADTAIDPTSRWVGVRVLDTGELVHFHDYRCGAVWMTAQQAVTDAIYEQAVAAEAARVAAEEQAEADRVAAEQAAAAALAVPAPPTGSPI